MTLTPAQRDRFSLRKRGGVSTMEYAEILKARSIKWKANKLCRQSRVINQWSSNLFLNSHYFLQKEMTLSLNNRIKSRITIVVQTLSSSNLNLYFHPNTISQDHNPENHKI